MVPKSIEHPDIYLSAREECGSKATYRGLEAAMGTDPCTSDGAIDPDLHKQPTLLVSNLLGLQRKERDLN